MKVTFGICASPNGNIDYLENLIYSIMDSDSIILGEENDAYEIIVSGNVPTDKQIANVTYMPFDESVKEAWITRKKNLMVQAAQYENIVLLHDYYLLDDLFWKGLSYYDRKNPDWKILMNTVWTYEGTRHSDWLVNQRYMDKVMEAYPHLADELRTVAPNENGPRWVCGLPYEVDDMTHVQYISGGYIVAKKSVLLECPFNEELAWGDSEDIIWSQDVIQHGYKFDFNPFCAVFLQKPGKWNLYQMPEEVLDCLREMFGKNDRRGEILKVRGMNVQ